MVDCDCVFDECFVEVLCKVEEELDDVLLL